MLYKAICLSVILQLVIGSAIERPVDYSQHQVIRILPNDVKQFGALENLGSYFNIDFWNAPAYDLRPILTAIGPDKIDFLSALNSSSIKYEIGANSLQKLIDEEKEEMRQSEKLRENKAIVLTTYNTYANILAQLKEWAAQSSKVTYRSVGNTYQGREIGSIRISSGGTKKVVILECGIHAREWISPATCLYMANELITKDLPILTKCDFIIIPNTNSDGYVYTHTNDRMWRKTRVPNSGSTCIGADPNRNWATSHCTNGASTNPCSETYCGPRPFSDNCTKAVSDYVISLGSANIAAYFGLHAYGQMWMYPWGYKTGNPPHNSVLNACSAAAASAIRATNNIAYTYGTIAQTIYVASGSSVDWTYEARSIIHSYACEMRDTGSYGFTLPANQIQPNSVEFMAGMTACLNTFL